MYREAYQRKKRREKGIKSREKYLEKSEKQTDKQLENLKELLDKNSKIKGKEIAEIMGVTPAWVSKLKKRLKN
ncbi:replication protein, partial [Bacillus cereus]